MLLFKQVSSYYDSIEQITVAQLLLKYLELEQVDKAFGIPGSALAHVLYEMGTAKDFEYVICRQETGAAYIAEGYARVTNRLGVVVVTSGPGATNALTGAMNAQSNGSPVMVISGEIPESYFGKGYLQEGIDARLDIDVIFHNAVEYSAVITHPNNFQTLFTQALRESLSLPRRASHISLPDDIAGSAINNVQFPQSPENYRVTPGSSDPAQARAALDSLLSTQKPLLFLGNGTRQALQGELLQKFSAFVDRFAIPVMTTSNGKGVFPENHPMSLRNYGMASSGWTTAYLNPSHSGSSEYDSLLVIGSSLGQLATAKWNPILIPGENFIQVDLNQHIIARSFPVTMGIVAEAGKFIEQLIEAAADYEPDQKVQQRRALIEEIKSQSPFRNPASMDSAANPMFPQALMKQITEEITTQAQKIEKSRRNRHIHFFVDCANCVGWTLHYISINSPRIRMHYSLGMGPMGFGVCAVIGGKMGSPGDINLAVVGDGAFLMQGAEISTAAAHNVGAIWIVLNDNDLGMVTQGMEQLYPAETPIWEKSYTLGKPNLKKFAESLGADAYDAYTPEEARKALERCIRNADSKQKPQVIVAHIDRSQLPPYYPVKAGDPVLH